MRHSIVNALNATTLHTLKIIKIEKFMLKKLTEEKKNKPRKQ